MTASVIRYTSGPLTFTTAEQVDGALFVEARTSGLVGLAADASTTVLGVAQKPSAPEGTYPGEPVDGVLDIAGMLNNPPELAVIMAPATCGITAAETIAFGARITSAAGGKARTATDSDPIHGICVDPRGITTNHIGWVKLV